MHASYADSLLLKSTYAF